MKLILVPLDFSEATAPVVEEGAKLAQAIDGHVVLLHVVRLPLPRYSTEMANLAQAQSGFQIAVEERLARIKSQLRTRGIFAHVLQVTGEPAAEIVDEAEKFGVEYIVMGSHGHSAVHDLILGSTTRAVLKHAKRPVVVVPPLKKTAQAPRRGMFAHVTPRRNRQVQRTASP